MFERLDRLNEDPILGLMARYRADPAPDKVDLGVGVFRDLGGNTPVLYPAVVNTPGMVMGYFDGNTVTGYWNYAQHYAMNDNSYNTQFGPSSPGAINVISGQTNGVIVATAENGGATGAAAAKLTQPPVRRCIRGAVQGRRRAGEPLPRSPAG